MAEESIASFSAFWQKSMGKLKGKEVIHKSPVTSTGSVKEDDEAALASERQKHRRAQVRKAQKEHRQRKENYVQTLEQDVARLRTLITSAEAETVGLKQENTAIRETLSKTDIPIPPPSSNETQVQESSPSRHLPQLSPTVQMQQPSSSGFSQQSAYLSSDRPLTPLTKPNNVQSPFSYDLAQSLNAWTTAQVNINFDDLIGAHCLHISPTTSSTTTTTTTTSTSREDRTGSLMDPYNHLMTDSAFNSTINPSFPATAGAAMTADPVLSIAQAQRDLTTMAINFILALEHPCRTHFKYPMSPQSTYSKATGDFSGHQLMATTLLYSHAPESIFANLENATNVSWQAPMLQLGELYAMSQSLEKGDLEITPVQAWFLLLERFDVHDFLQKGNWEALQSGLASITKCVCFGAAMELEKFWEITRAVVEDV